MAVTNQPHARRLLPRSPQVPFYSSRYARSRELNFCYSVVQPA